MPIEDACDWLWRWPEWLRPAVGGLALGGLLLVLPEMYGVGYPVLGRGVAGHYALLFLLALLVAKMIATSLTIGIGGSGGVFAPKPVHRRHVRRRLRRGAPPPDPRAVAGPAGAYGLIGMGAVFAGAARAPITAVIILFELTGEYTIILPLMAAIVLATGVSHLLSRDTIYTLKLRRRGIDIDSPDHTGPLGTLTADQAAEPVGQTLPAGTRLIDAAAELAHSRHGQLPVTAPDGTYLGIVTAHTVADTLADGDHDADDVTTVLEQPTAISAHDTLDDALDLLDTAGAAAVPIVRDDGDDGGAEVIGWLTHQAVLSALRSGLPVDPASAPSSESMPLVR